jgi:hypothetical protein
MCWVSFIKEPAGGTVMSSTVVTWIHLVHQRLARGCMAGELWLVEFTRTILAEEGQGASFLEFARLTYSCNEIGT